MDGMGYGVRVRTRTACLSRDAVHLYTYPWSDSRLFSGAMFLFHIASSFVALRPSIGRFFYRRRVALVQLSASSGVHHSSPEVSSVTHVPLSHLVIFFFLRVFNHCH